MMRRNEINERRMNTFCIIFKIFPLLSTHVYYSFPTFRKKRCLRELSDSIDIKYVPVGAFSPWFVSPFQEANEVHSFHSSPTLIREIPAMNPYLSFATSCLIIEASVSIIW